jgi:hypothetical protein
MFSLRILIFTNLYTFLEIVFDCQILVFLCLGSYCHACVPIKALSIFDVKWSHWVCPNMMLNSKWKVEVHVDKALALDAEPSKTFDRDVVVCLLKLCAIQLDRMLLELYVLRFSVVSWSKECSSSIEINLLCSFIRSPMNGHVLRHEEGVVLVGA